MSLTTYSMKDLLQAGVHFGHHPRRWNPKMERYIYGVRNGVHIINLESTYQLLEQALEKVKDVSSHNGRILFVGTKKQASSLVADYAKKCGQYYVNHRWLGGMLTNWKTVSQSIKRLDNLEKKLEKEANSLSKKETLNLTRSIERLDKVLGGIRKMGGLPDLIFVVDTIKEATAIQEAKKLGIPVIAVVDTNSNPDNIDFPIPGNDDASRSIEMYCKILCNAALEGIEKQVSTKKSSKVETKNNDEKAVVAKSSDEDKK